MSYSKLHSSLVNSSLWTETDEVRILFITLLAMCDRHGEVQGSRTGIERIANILPDPDGEDPWEILMSPDPDSSDLMRNPDNEGRRIEEIPGGFKLLNFEYYRGLRNEDDRREQNRLAQAKLRKRKQASAKVSRRKPASATNQPSPSVSVSDSESVLKEEKRREEGTREKRPQSVTDCIAYCREKGLTEHDGQWLWDKWQGNGFKNGGKPILDWRATVNQWKAQGDIFPSNKRGIKPSTFQRPKEAAPVYAKAPPPQPPLTPQEIERNKKLSSQMVNDLKQKMRP